MGRRYVIGQYRCGCSYGPVRRRDRLDYCAVHGENIQHEYPVPYPKNNRSNPRKGGKGPAPY